jgi:hypothetical protein
MTTKHDLGQYFTTHNELKEKVFEFILHLFSFKTPNFNI